MRKNNINCQWIDLYTYNNISYFYSFETKEIYSLKSEDYNNYKDLSSRNNIYLIGYSLVVASITRWYMGVSTLFLNLFFFSISIAFSSPTFIKYNNVLKKHIQNLLSESESFIKIEYNNCILDQTIKTFLQLLSLIIFLIMITIVSAYVFFKYSILVMLLSFNFGLFLSVMLLINLKIDKRYRAIKEIKEIYKLNK